MKYLCKLSNGTTYTPDFVIFIELYGDLIDSLFDYDQDKIEFDTGEGYLSVRDVIAKTNINKQVKKGDKIDLIYIDCYSPHLLHGEKVIDSYQTLFELKLKATLNYEGWN